MSTIETYTTPGDVIENIIFEKLSPSLDGVMKRDAVLSMLTFSCLLMRPELDDPDLLQTTVEKMSEVMVTALAPSATQATQ